MAKICDVTPQAVQQWFVSTTPTAENVALVAKEFRGNPYWVILGEGEMRTSESLDPSEQSLIEAWRSMSPGSKDLVLSEFQARFSGRKQG